MKSTYFKKVILLFTLLLLGLFVLAGCYGRYSYPVKPFAYDKIPADAAISMTFNADGYFFIADKNGKTVQTQKISFEKLMKLANKESPGWIEILGSYTLFQIKGDRRVWLCDNEFECVEARPNDKNDKAVFSLNYDYKNNIMFFADKDGNRLDMEKGDKKGFKRTSRISAVQGDEMVDQTLKAFATLVQEIDFSKKNGIKALNSFVIYKIKGSDMVAWYSELTHIWTVTCMDRSGFTCGFDAYWRCPIGDCPRLP